MEPGLELKGEEWTHIRHSGCRHFLRIFVDTGLARFQHGETRMSLNTGANLTNAATLQVSHSG